MADNRIYATGKRKCAVARVWLTAGEGKFTINKRSADDYFLRESTKMVMRQSLELLEAQDKYDVWSTVRGGCHNAQAEALRHGIAGALSEADATNRAALEKAGFLHRDAREKARKKHGQQGPRKAVQ